MNFVLVVDDNNLDRRLIAGVLNNSFSDQIAVIEASDGIEALRIIENQDIDLIITDLVMPNLEGLELIRKLTQKPNSTNIIAVSGRNPYYLLMAKKIGVNSIFTKPLDKEKFLNTVGNILNISLKHKVHI